MTTFVLQLSDLHVFAEPSERLRGVATRESLQDVLAAVRRTGLEFSRVVVTGDLTHDERLESYQAVRGLLKEWLPRGHVIPGNHDDRALICEVFPDCTEGDETGIRFSTTAGSWRLIGIDTHVPGEVSGDIAPDMLEWLEAELATDDSTPTILFQHHPPVPVGSAWVDDLGLRDPSRLHAVLARAPQVRVISCGHVHQEFSGTLGSAIVLTMPSSGVQFVPLSPEAKVDLVPPGFRVLALEDDGWSSQVVRLSDPDAPPSIE